MEKCTDTVVNWMIRCNAINEADKELYKYALYSFSIGYHHLILAGVIGFGLGSVNTGVALIFVVVLRNLVVVIMQKICTLVFLDLVFYCFCA